MKWTEEHLNFLREHSYLKETELAQILNTTKGSIHQACRRYNIEINLDKKYWTPEEEICFKTDWENESLSYKYLSKKYKNRSVTALKSKAKRLGLSKRQHDSSYLTIKDITTEMQVSKDRVRNWIKHGLKYHNSQIKPYKYLISQSDLLSFLEKHQDLFNASKISEYLFIDEPDWLKKKRRNDRNKFIRKMGIKYTNSEKKTVEQLFKIGKSNADIAKTLNRTESGIERLLYEMNLSRKKYNSYEIEIIRNNADTKTIDEIVKMLPLRTKSGIIAKCQQLHIKYHSKKR